MASIESILQLIVDRPGMTASELGEQLELAPADVQSRLAKYIDNGQVKRDKKKVDGRELLIYFPAQSLIDEADGVKRIVKPATAKRAAAAVAAPPAAISRSVSSRMAVSRSPKAPRKSDSAVTRRRA